MIEIVFYTTGNGRVPFLAWLDGLDKISRSIVKMRLDHIRIGNFGDSKPIKGGVGLWELRLHYGAGYRIYFGKKGARIVVLLVGGNKGSQARDIDKAKGYWIACKELL